MTTSGEDTGLGTEGELARSLETPRVGADEESQDSSSVPLKWVQLTSVPEQIEASLAAGFLESEGVKCHIESRNFTQEPTNLALLGNYVLFVHEDAVDRARRLLEDRLELSVDAAQETSLGSLLRAEQAASEASAREEE